MDAFELSTELLERAAEDLQRLRWVVVAMHQAVQSAMVCALTGSNGMRVMNFDRKAVQRWAEHLMAYSRSEGDVELLPLPPALETFTRLYQKVRDPEEMMQRVDSKPFEGTYFDHVAIHRLNQERNRYVHVTPGSHWLHVGVVLDCVERSLGLLEFLTFESKNFEWRIEYKRRTEHVRALFERAAVALSALRQSLNIRPMLEHAEEHHGREQH